jgi:hypothetical protein
MIVRRRISFPLPGGCGQQEPESAPPVEDVVPISAVPPVEHGVPVVEVGADGFELRICGGGLNPPTPSSVEPMGIPARPTLDDEVAIVGDEADAAG